MCPSVRIPTRSVSLPPTWLLVGALIPLLLPLSLTSSGTAKAQTVAGQAIAFNGTDAYVNVPSSASLKIPNAVTLTAWVKRTRDGIDIILEKGGDWTLGQTNYGWGLHSVNNHMFYFFYNGGWRGTAGVTDFGWHHYAVVARNGDANPTFYLDGVARSTQYTGGSAIISLNSASNLALHLGAQIGSYTYYGANILDDVSIWNRVLTSAEINAAMADTLGPALYGNPASGLVAYYRCDRLEDLGVNGDGADDLRDLTTGANHGDVVGGAALVPSGAFPMGACCYPDGQCAVTTAAHCQAPGTWSGSGTYCVPNPCAQPLGACCRPDDTCVITTLAGCPAPNVWQSPGAPCEPNPCPNTTAVTGGSHGVLAPDVSVAANPSRGQVVIRYHLPTATVVTLEVFDASGKVIRRLDQGPKSTGSHAAVWDARDQSGSTVPAGVYLTRIETREGAGGAHVVLVK